MYRIAYSTLCGALLSTAALAAPATQSTAPTPVAQAPIELAQASQPAVVGSATASAVAPAEKKVCRLLPSSYSHRMDRVCLTKDEWKQVDDQMRQ